VARVLQACHVNVEQQPLDVAEYTENKSLSSSSDSFLHFIRKCKPWKNYHYGETAADAIEHLVGWVAYKFKSTHPNLGVFTYESKQECGYSLSSWLEHLSFGGIKKAKPGMVRYSNFIG
jgi:hypothetical protein